MIWNVVILAAGRGPDDPMAKAYGVTHKCLLPIAGTPMLARVVSALANSASIGTISISIEHEALLHEALGELGPRVSFIASGTSAAASALTAAQKLATPLLVTTGDHALLTPAIVNEFLSLSESRVADLTVGLASAEVILQAFPQTKRTFLRFGRDQVSGCNLYALKNDSALNALRFWEKVEQDRKNPLKLMRAFGPRLLFAWATGLTSLEHAFRLASRKLSLVASPILLTNATAAIDVDKPADKELVEEILAG